MAEQTEAQRLADALEEKPDSDGHCRQAAAELRRLDAVNAQLLEALEALVAADNLHDELWDQVHAAIVAARSQA